MRSYLVDANLNMSIPAVPVIIATSSTTTVGTAQSHGNTNSAAAGSSARRRRRGGGGGGGVAGRRRVVRVAAKSSPERRRVASLPAVQRQQSAHVEARRSSVLDGVEWRGRAKHPWLDERSSSSPKAASAVDAHHTRARRGNCRPVRCTRGASARLEPSCIQLKEFNYL